jgi:acyl carrier protein
MSSAHPAPARDRLREIWCELLSLDQVGDEENFFVLSGRSVDAIRLVNRIRSEFGLEVTVRTLFDGPTVAQLHEALETAPSASARPGLTGGTRSG